MTQVPIFLSEREREADIIIQLQSDFIYIYVRVGRAVGWSADDPADVVYLLS